MRQFHDRRVGCSGVADRGQGGRQIRGESRRFHVQGLIADLHAGRRPGSSVQLRVDHRRPSEGTFGHVAGIRELRGADRVELERAVVGVGDNDDLHFLMGRRQRRVGSFREQAEHREVADHRDQAAPQNDRFAPDFVRQPAEQDEPARSDRQRPGHQQIAGIAVDLQHRGQEEQRVELASVPNHRLPGDHAEQREDGPFGVLPLAERLAQRRLGMGALGLHFQEGWAFRQLHADPDGDREQQHGNDERHAPAPVGEVLRPQSRLGEQDHHQRHEQTHGRGGLNPAGVETAAIGRGMLRDISRGAAIFAAERQTLQQAQRDEHDGRRDADRVRSWQDADDERGRAHDHDGDQKGVFAPDQIAQPAEYQCAEGAHQEAGGERQQREDIARAFGELAEELGADNRSQRPVEIEIVPLKYGT